MVERDDPVPSTTLNYFPIDVAIRKAIIIVNEPVQTK